MHPVNEFWKNKSGWSTWECPNIDDGLSEAQLCTDAWNEAITQCQNLIKDSYGFDFYEIANKLDDLKYTRK